MNDLHTAQSNSETSIDNNNFVNKRDENNSKNNKKRNNWELDDNSYNFSCDNMLLVLTIIMPFCKLMLIIMKLLQKT